MLAGEVLDFGLKKRQMSRKIFFPKLSELIDIQALAGGDKPRPYRRNLSGRRLAAIQNLFGSLELGIWILFDICYLMLGFFYIQRLNIYLAILFDFSNVFLGHSTRR